MRRLLALLPIALVLAPGTWLRDPVHGEVNRLALRVTPMALPPGSVQRAHLGAFRLEGVWQLSSAHRWFGGYSALLLLDGGQMLAISDDGRWLRFPQPGVGQGRPAIGDLFASRRKDNKNRDVEAAVRDPATGTVWIALERSMMLARFERHRPGYIMTTPPDMRGWRGNYGPESMARLADGRFIILEERFPDLLGTEGGRHDALIYRGDPFLYRRAKHFTFVAPSEFTPSDMAALPDGRMLILLRKLVWPMPLRFAGRIVVADPREIRPGAVWRSREVAKLSSSLPVDNFEGIAIEPRQDGRVTVWLISDDNRGTVQRTLLWKLVVDPARLPGGAARR